LLQYQLLADEFHADTMFRQRAVVLGLAATVMHPKIDGEYGGGENREPSHFGNAVLEKQRLN
jgi:hypothetical protein